MKEIMWLAIGMTLGWYVKGKIDENKTLKEELGKKESK